MYIPFPTPQGLQSQTFTPPKLDGSLVIADLFDFHADHSPNHPLFVYDQTTITWKEGGRAIRTASSLILSKVKSQTSTTIAIIADTDAFTYLTLVSGIMRAGYLPFPISLRNSPIALAHLLQICKCTHAFVSQDPSTKALFEQASALFSNDYEITVIDIPSFGDLFNSTRANEPIVVKRPSLTEPAIILHSSGSTSLPKPVYMTQRHVLNCGMLPYYGERDLCGSIWSAHSLPMYHAMGIHFIMHSTCSGIVMSHFHPEKRVKIPSADLILSGAINSRSGYMFCVPSVIEEWALNLESRRLIASFEAIVYAGAPLDRKIGSELMADGIKIAIVYGCSEAPAPAMVLPSDSSLHYEYFKMSQQSKPHLVPQPGLPGVFELVFIAWDHHYPSVINFQVETHPAFATNDLIERHLTLPDMWRIYGRADDQIMHSNGQKTNPIPIENIFLQDNRVVAAVMFGRGKPQAGILLDLHPHYKFEPDDIPALQHFRKSLQDKIDEANTFAPQHSRIFPEMIILSHPDKPIVLVAKGRPQRSAVLTAYESEIEGAYGAVNEASQPKILPPEEWSPDQTNAFICAVVISAMGIDNESKLSDHDDLFTHGCDSIGATWIRNSIQRAIRETLEASLSILPQNVVYMHPTIEKLSYFTLSLISGAAKPHEPAAKTRVETINSLLNKYSADITFTHLSNAPSMPVLRCVMLTGSTGALGSHILVHLILSPLVDRIYALNRASASISIVERQKTQFVNYGLDTMLLNSPKLYFLNADLSTQDLGLSDQSHQEMTRHVTTIIHSAWAVDFNFTLPSFEPQIRGVRNLLNFALCSEISPPPHIIFTSSISAVANWSHGPVPEVCQSDPAVAADIGYGESKWIGEQLLQHVSNEVPQVRATIIRIGQLSGGMNGYWRPTEWFPALVRAGHRIGCLPEITGDVSWLPIHKAGEFIVQAVSFQSTPPVVHLRHPKPIQASIIISHIADKWGVKIVSYDQWLMKLQVEEDPSSLLPFFKRLIEVKDKEAFGNPILSLDIAHETFKGLDNVTPLRTHDVDAWMGHWRM